MTTEVQTDLRADCKISQKASLHGYILDILLSDFLFRWFLLSWLVYPLVALLKLASHALPPNVARAHANLGSELARSMRWRGQIRAWM